MSNNKHTPTAALDGIRIIDLTQLLQGPYATQMLGDLGADVIKVERFRSGDLYRSMTFFDEWIEGTESPCFMPWNRNKRSISLNLKCDDGKAVLRKLIQSADVIVENFRPGVMARLGFSYEDVQTIKPDIIYCSASGWGTSGPYVSRPGQDLLVQGVSGAMTTSGRASDGPVAIGTALCDQVSALNAVYGILAALFHRQRTGQGQLVEVNLLSSAIAFQMQDFFTIQNMGRQFERPQSGIAHPGNGAPFGTYKTLDGYIVIAMGDWHTLVEALEAPHLEKYADSKILFEKRDEIFFEIEEITKTKGTEAWIERLLSFDLWVSRVNQQCAVEHDPQVIHNETFVDVEHPKAGRVKVTNVPVKLSKTPGKIDKPAPLLGQHGKEILSEVGYREEEIAALFKGGVVYSQNEENAL
ncbi:CaiB/BaiF CoA-transferase family protein [Aestuariibacter sp. A3R04]|uniref:CaiB/BaiF CoA transferase family protein n=1 Tax=Aestuariibacter sp. A3R04 TaxID=2841571 RepID=UPI001C08B214|nr:CaiB/BaiF CoA-transferase family protein [Aestuariibacter sp. A3R04]MBU3021488.1 CoA transferase [Aestuariibacter sp. A3R04]